MSGGVTSLTNLIDTGLVDEVFDVGDCDWSYQGINFGRRITVSAIPEVRR